MTTKREILLVGSVPLSPAEEVFSLVAHHLGDLVRCIPDGEQSGWNGPVNRSFLNHPLLQVYKKVALNQHGSDPIEIFRLKSGASAKDLVLGPYGYAQEALKSHAAFKQLKNEGKIPSHVRHQITLPGPGTSACRISLAAEELLPIARAALLGEIREIERTIDKSDITIQIDVAMEAEHEEYLRRPQDFDQPIHTTFDWTLEQMAESVAWLGNRISREIELGFHICSIWHHNPEAGQDNTVLVDVVNAISARVNRPIAYYHIPIIPDHQQDDFDKLASLKTTNETKIFLGLINLADGAEGTKKRIVMAQKVLDDFGISFFCGLGRPRTTSSRSPQIHLKPPVPGLTRATAASVDDVLELHRIAAQF